MCTPDKCTCGLVEIIEDELDRWDEPVEELWEYQDRRRTEESVDRMTDS